MIRFVLLLLGVLLFIPPAAAASFDCGKAATAFEKAVCASPDLSRQDEILGKAYATAIGGLSQPALDAVQGSQHDWLDYAARACGDDGQPIAGAYTDDQAQCLSGVYHARISALEASRMLGGYRFYPVEHYLLEPDTDADSNGFNKLAEKHFLTVKIDGDDATAKAFNAMTEAMRAGYTELFDADGALAKGDTTDDVDVTTVVKSVNAARITLETDDFSYGHGAAHGNYGISYAHFLTGENRPLEARDVFAGKGWEAKLGALVLAAIKAELGDGYFPDSEADIPAWAASPGRWDFTPEGLVVQFNPYEVTAYAGGAPTVTIPWAQLQDLFAPHGDEIATYP